MPEPRHKNKTNGLGYFEFRGDGFVLGSLKDLQSKNDPYLRSLDGARVSYSEILDVVGINKSFFVCLTNIDDELAPPGGCGKPIGREICIARMVKKGKRVHLERETPLFHVDYDGKGEETMRRISKEDQSFYDYGEKKGYLFAFCYVPTTINEALAVDNAVVCSIEPFTPSPVVLDEGTLLGRLNDTIQPIDMRELKQILNGDQDTYLKLNKKEMDHVFKDIKSTITKTITSMRKTLPLRTRRLDLVENGSTIASSMLQLKPGDRPTSPKPGVVIFNKQSKSLEYYDGSDWKTLKTE